MILLGTTNASNLILNYLIYVFYFFYVTDKSLDEKPQLREL